MLSKIKHQFTTDLWKDSQDGGWYFVTLPANHSEEIRNHLQWQEEGWGRMKAAAIIQDVEWDTAIWFDTKSKRYLLPVKAVIRKKLSLKEGDKVAVTILI